MMPPVVGVYQSRAESLLRAAGLSVGKVTSEYSDEDAGGVVISASFNEGDKLNPGTVVNLVVSKGAKPSEPGDTNNTGSRQWKFVNTIETIRNYLCRER